MLLDGTEGNQVTQKLSRESGATRADGKRIRHGISETTFMRHVTASSAVNLAYVQGAYSMLDSDRLPTRFHPLSDEAQTRRSSIRSSYAQHLPVLDPMKVSSRAKCLILLRVCGRGVYLTDWFHGRAVGWIRIETENLIQVSQRDNRS